MGAPPDKTSRKFTLDNFSPTAQSQCNRFVKTQLSRYAYCEATTIRIEDSSADLSGALRRLKNNVRSAQSATDSSELKIA